MKLKELMEGIPDIEIVNGSTGEKISWENLPEDGCSIADFAAYSQRVQSGDMYAAMNSNDYVEEAIEKGAVAILTKELPKELHPGVMYILHEKPAYVLPYLNSKVFSQRPQNTIAVTGTAGKTSTVFYAYQIAQKLGIKSACIGNFGVLSEEPEILDMIRRKKSSTIRSVRVLDNLAKNDINFVPFEAISSVIDVSSLPQHRGKENIPPSPIDFIAPNIGVLTILGTDHIDLHGSVGAYHNAKLRLFKEVLPKKQGAVAVLNADEPRFQEMKEDLQEKNVKIISYGKSPEADISIKDIKPHEDGQSITFHVRHGQSEVIQSLNLRAYGKYQASNLAAAIGIVLATGVRIEKIFPGKEPSILEDLKPFPYRMEEVKVKHPKGARIFRDYAHNPEEYRAVINAVKDHFPGKKVCILVRGYSECNVVDIDKWEKAGKQIISADKVYIAGDSYSEIDCIEKFSNKYKVAATSPDIAGVLVKAVRQLQDNDILIVATGIEQGRGFDTKEVINLNGKEILYDEIATIKQGVESLKQDAFVAKLQHKTGARAMGV